MEDRTCVVCGLSFTPSRTGSVCCSRACWASRGVPECSVDGCNKPNRARGLCGSHYNQTHQKDRHAKRAVPCSVCGSTCEKYASGTRRPVCGYRCWYAITYGKDIAEGREMVGPVPRRPISKPESAPERIPKLRFVEGACVWCGERFTFDLRVTGTVARFCRPQCARSHHKAQRRARRGQFSVSPTVRLSIYERDGWDCQLCGEPVNPGLGPSHPWGATLDHIECQSWTLVPDHSPSNLRLAHRMCNSVRGSRSA